MASGHVNRANRPNTWLTDQALRREVFPCGELHEMGGFPVRFQNERDEQKQVRARAIDRLTYVLYAHGGFTMSNSDCFVAMFCCCLKMASAIELTSEIESFRPVVDLCFSKCKKVYTFCT